jgi:hypothetical protein
MFIEKLTGKPGALEAHGRLACGNAAGLLVLLNLAPQRGAGFCFAHYLIKHHYVR